MTLTQLSILWYIAICISIVLFSHEKTWTSVLAFLVVGGVLIFTFRPQYNHIRRKLLKTVLFPCVVLLAGTVFWVVGGIFLEKYQEHSLSEISSVEVYDTTLSKTGILEGYVKNNSNRTLKKLRLNIVVFNARGDITFSDVVAIECNVPSGQTRHFDEWGLIPYECFIDKYSWSILNYVALG